MISKRQQNSPYDCVQHKDTKTFLPAKYNKRAKMALDRSPEFLRGP